MKMASEDRIIVMITHLVEEIQNYVDYSIIIDDGYVVFEGETKNKDIRKIFSENVNMRGRKILNV